MSLQVLREDDRLRLRLNRPEARNALNNATLQALLDALDRAARDAQLRCVVLEGEGGAAFCAGIDLVERRTLDVDAMGRQSRLVLDVVRALAFSPLPVIAAIDGWCLGAGLEVALACDLRIASEASRFGFPEMALGTYPGAGGAVLLPRVVGPARATELLMSTRRLDAAQALQAGLVHAVAPRDRFAAAVDDAFADLQKMSRAALRAVKESMRRSVVLPLDEAFELDQGLRRPLDSSPEHRQALQRAPGR
jgi:enoyl-CoA hydratase/carnithine racemase